jgi:hypothetical protein
MYGIIGTIVKDTPDAWKVRNRPYSRRFRSCGREGDDDTHTGWFVESLAAQTLVLFIIRTAGNRLRSRPSTPLAITTIPVAAVGFEPPFSPLARILGFLPLPRFYFAFLAGATATYLLFVEIVKRHLMRGDDTTAGCNIWTMTFFGIECATAQS